MNGKRPPDAHFNKRNSTLAVSILASELSVCILLCVSDPQEWSLRNARITVVTAMSSPWLHNPFKVENHM